jgi:CBS domain-containing protein
MEREETYGGKRHEAALGEAPQGEAPHNGALQGEAPQGEAVWRDARSEGAQVIRLRPLRVLVVSAEEPFRAASTMLIERRDCVVFSLPSVYGAAELIAHERLDVAVVDGAEPLRAIAGELAQAGAPVGVVSVGDAEDVGLPGGPQLARWTRFEELFDAIERADRARARECAAEGRWPAGARSHGLD